ncbi:MAG: BRO family protein [bacterium]
MKENIQNSLAIFETYKIRRVYDEQKEVWYFSVIDIVAVLTEQVDFKKAKSYWTTLKNRLKQEGSELVTKCDQLKMQSADGKFYNTDAANVETLLRLIQSVPSKKAEPIKLWLARVGYERMQEMSDPEIALNRSRTYWQKQGRSEKWIQQRMTGQETRNKLTDYWSNHNVKKGEEFAILTNIIHQEWSDLSVKNHKDLKGLKTQNLRDHMSEEELIFSALAELSTRKIAETEKAFGIEDNKIPAKKGGKIAKDARLALEEKTGESVVTGQNFLRRNIKEENYLEGDLMDLVKKFRKKV